MRWRCENVPRLCCRHRHHHHHRPHHHHCHGVLSYCAFHNHYFHCHCHRHRQGSNIVTPSLPPQNPESFVPFPVGNNSNVMAAEHKAADGAAAQISQEQEHLDLDEEEDEEPIFVLTDEWRDFFAKSEARRQQEKKNRKKGKK
ncbi:SKI/DACH domain-containing protein 1-like [Neltuma alba]|uniref:SKI/DACH domain-containing protein 1-like n=1 Tax=Neltuma alba TaxID=207710 RepID=UPI0010A57F9A|nr:SKI/DACH domain-containing protein 1-like [Prosopis alba]